MARLLRIACTCSLILAVQCGLYADDGTSDKFWGYAPTAAGETKNTCGDRANNTCGPVDWDEVDVGNSSCGALYQSPINLNTTGATFSDYQAAVKLSTDLACTKGGMYSVDPHGIEVNINLTCQSKMNATWTLGNQTNVYSLLSYRFHTPSEHTINGQFFDMEAHLIHKHSVTGDILVLAVFMNRTPPSRQNALLSTIIMSLASGPTLSSQCFSVA
jgi:carbonic anhydrase